VNSTSVQVQLESLAKLQEIDRQIDHLQQKRSSLPVALQSLIEKHKGLEQAATQKSTEAVEVEKLIRQVQAAIEINQDRMNRSSQRLEQMENQSTFLAANKEVEQLKKLGSELDSQKAAYQTQKDGIVAAQADIENQKKGIEEERRVMETQFLQESSVVEQDLQQLIAGRSGFVSLVERSTLARYDRVRSARAGLGIVPAVQGRCTGCNVTIPPQMFNQLHRLNDVMSCPSCARILFIPKTQ